MLEPISDDLEEKIKQNFNEGEYWQIRILIDDLYQKTGIPTDYFANLILSYYTERDNCTKKRCINPEKLEQRIFSSMKENESPEIKAKGYLLSIGWTGLGEMTAKEVNGELYCFPKAVESFNPKINELPIEAIIKFKDGQIIYVMANYGAKILKKRSPKRYTEKGDFPLAN
ncbi:MAG: hypothetical protein QXE31_03015 [Candidatus Woesearchaeota archaeon]